MKNKTRKPKPKQANQTPQLHKRQRTCTARISPFFKERKENKTHTANSKP